jgi:hypothetical protein
MYSLSPPLFTNYNFVLMTNFLESDSVCHMVFLLTTMQVFMRENMYHTVWEKTFWGKEETRSSWVGHRCQVQWPQPGNVSHCSLKKETTYKYFVGHCQCYSQLLCASYWWENINVITFIVRDLYLCFKNWGKTCQILFWLENPQYCNNNY